jgi:hypothetical protein
MRSPLGYYEKNAGSAALVVLLSPRHSYPFQILHVLNAQSTFDVQSNRREMPNVDVKTRSIIVLLHPHTYLLVASMS